ncbi:MAG: hypothetical protein PHY45_03090 [Rhodocyclaceae bacterium]|nr:hypothetical protein [Rhodocyclaceae bacterium]
MRNDPLRLLVLLPLAAALAGCGSWKVPTNLSGHLPAKGSVVPATTFNLTPSLSIPLEKMVFWGAYAGAAYLILDPWAPNWDIEEAKFPGDHYKMSLHMKRYYAGGAGEAREVFHRRARELVQAGGYDGYEVIEYSEGLESSVLGSRRVAEGVIALTKKED